MNQDYVRIHPYGDSKPRIITPEILKDFKNGLCEVMKDRHFEFNVEYDEFHRVKSVGMCLPGRSSLFVYRASDNCLKYVKSRRQWPKRTYDKIHDLIAEDLSNERNTQLLEVDPKNLKKVIYHPDSFTPTYSVQLVNDQLVERLVEIENRMIEEAVEDQRTKQGSKFKQFLIEFKHMKPEEQNSVIYSFTDLLKRMHEIHDDSVERKYNAKIENAENQWEKFKDERRKND